jgi:hypothetical protein
MADDKDKDNEKGKGILSGVGNTLNEITKFFDVDLKSITKKFFDFKTAFNELEKGASAVNYQLLLSRTRISEFKTTIADTAPLVAKLGGNLQDVVNTINETSTALGRNVIFEPEVYEKLFAAQQLLGKGTETLIRNFSEAGIMTSKIGENLEKSLQYVRTVGVDARTVIGDVVDNTDLLNRFSFKDGVEGFTKMAAQASIIKASMRDIASFADKVFEPEGAIETAAAFQRLGVFVGDLADPFTLMNKSLNDPEGLIMNLASAGEKFTQFNEEAGRFEINPSAMGQMKALAEAAGVGVGEFKKMSLNLAEFNARASEIDIKFNLSDDQKMFIANLAYLDTDNEYKIKVTDEKTGESIATAVKDLTDKQINKLNELSKEEPKTLEDLTRDSMNIQQLVQNDVNAIKNKLLFGFVGEQSVVGKFQEGARTVAGDLGDILYKGIPNADVARKTIRGVADPVGQMYKGGDFGAEMVKIFQAVGGYIQEIPNNIARGVKESRIGSELNLEKYMNQLNTNFGDLSNLLSTGFNLTPPQPKVGATSFINTKDQADHLNEKIKGSSNSSNNQPPSQLAVNVELNFKNELGQFIDKKVITQVFNHNNTQNLANKISHTMDLRAMG